MMRCGGSRDRDEGRVANMDKEAGVRRSGDKYHPAVYVFDADIETISVQQTLVHQRHYCARDRSALEDVLDESFFLASDASQ